MFDAAILLVARAGQKPALGQPLNGAADLGLVDLGPRADVRRGQPSINAKMKEDPPLGSQHPVTILVKTLEIQARRLRGLREQVRKERLQVEIRIVCHCPALVSYKNNY